MRITKESIDQIYQATDIVEVVGDFVSLKKRGANYGALSPFTTEKTPSFYVSPSKQIFKCFSTGKGGDSVKFLMEVDSLTYVEALKYLAKKYSIELKYDREETDEQHQEQSDRDALFIALEYAKGFYQKNLFEHPDGQAIGLSYFKERGLNEKTIKDFDLGFAIETWDQFLKDAEKNQYSMDILEKAGLIKVNAESGRKFDFFRNRVIYPIHNVTGKVIALAGRILTNEKGVAKYINSPETELYHKSQVLYGMAQAKNTIRSEDSCLLVEGYMDVLSLYQAGITNVVASSGTSLTEDQVKLINRFTKNITVLYDGDTAGIKAAIRGTDLLLNSGLNIKVLVFPDGDDPDSYVIKVGEKTFREFMKTHAKDFITFKTEILLKDASNDPIKKAEVIREVVNSIARVKDPIQRAIYFKRCSQLLDIEEQVIISEYNKIQLANRKKQSPEGQYLGPENDIAESPLQTLLSVDSNELAEKEIVRILIEYSEFPMDEQTPMYSMLFHHIQNIEFDHTIYSKIIKAFKEELDKGNPPGLEYFMNHPDKEIEQCLIDLLTDKHELSETWQKFTIYVPARDEDVIMLVNKSISRLNFEKARSQYKKNQQKLLLQTDTEFEEIELLLETQKIIKGFMIQYAKEVGIVISG